MKAKYAVIPGLFLYSWSFAQSREIQVWPGTIPGAIPNPVVQEHVLLTESGAERIAGVVEPLIFAYLPAREKANGTAVIICPGGGYARLAFDYEGSEVASWLSGHGIAGFVLKYRLPNSEIMQDKSIGPLQDIQETVRIVRRNAAAWGIRPDRIGVMGFSAGGHLASSAATHFADKVYSADSTSARPDFSILIYPVISMNGDITHKGSRNNLLGESPDQELVDRFSSDLQVTPDTPPAFLVHAADDATVPVENSIRYLLALRRNKVPAELHIYEKGGHGFGFAAGRGTAEDWPRACLAWLRGRGLIP
jgi:acetyl esterase/lipase